MTMIEWLRRRLSRRRAQVAGVNLIGYFRAESGVGEIARLYLAMLDAAGIPVAVVPFDRTRNRQEHPLPIGAPGEPIYDVNLLCINADQLPIYAAEHPSVVAGRRNIGVWAWEVEEFPDEMARSADLVDEIWGISSFTADAIRRKVTKPVVAMPLPIDLTPPPLQSRSELGLPAGFLVLSCYDFESVIERKNPLGSLAAFRSAFPEPGEATLVLKSVNGHFHPDQLARVCEAAKDRPDVLVLDGYLARGRQRALIASCDLFLSLHRAEGFGLMIAEAMAFGRAVVATAYGGPMDFLDDEHCAPIRWQRSAIAPGSGPYSGTWADPDIGQAAEALRAARASAGDAAPGAGARSERFRRLHSPAARVAGLRAALEGGADGRTRPLGDATRPVPVAAARRAEHERRARSAARGELPS